MRFKKNNGTVCGRLQVQSPNTGSETYVVDQDQLEGANPYSDAIHAATQDKPVSPPLSDMDRFRREVSGDIVPPRTSSEKSMAKIWADILKLKEVSVHDNFFDYGRNSSLAMEMIARVRKVFAVNLSVQQLFQDPTVAGMTAAVLSSQHLQHHPLSTNNPA